MQNNPVLGASQKLEFQRKAFTPRNKEHERQIQIGICETKNNCSHAAGVQRRWFKPVQPQGKMIKSTQKLESPQKVRVPKKRNSNLPPPNLQFFTGNFFLLNPKIAKIHENSPATWIVYRHLFSHFLGFSVQGKKIPVAFWALDGPEVRVPKKKEL